MENIRTFLKSVDKGLYRDAKQEKMDAVSFFARKAREAGVVPEGAEWEQRKAAFRQRFKLQEKDHGSLRDQAVLRFALDTYAIEKAYAEYGVQVRGREASTVEKAFATSSSTVLFPVFIDSQVIAGMLDISLVPQLVATEVQINAHVADHMTMGDAAADRQTGIVGELAEIPALRVKTTDQRVYLKKFGAALEASYEVLRLQRLNVISIFLNRLGAQVGIDETDELIEVAIAGDGNTNSAVTDTDAEVAGTLDYDEIVRLFLAFPKGYQMRQAVVNDEWLRTILNMSEFKDPQAGFNFQRTGEIVAPVGATWHRWSSTGSASFSTDRILAVDDRYALIQYTEGGTLTEQDRIIDHQFERVQITKWTGFGKLDYNATQCLDIS